MAKKMLYTITADELGINDDNDLKLYCTPGSIAPYWASQPNFSNDVCVATVQDFLSDAGFDSIEGFEGDFTFDMQIELPEPL